MALQGIWAQEQFVREHPQHWCLDKFHQESMEGWIDLLKQYQRKRGNMDTPYIIH